MYRKRMSDALREAREYRDPTCPICEGEGCQCPQGDETINEGFKSAAQRRAAFASGYKAKGKKKKEETEAEELEEKFTSAQIKQAYGILNDPRYKQGNYSGAVNVINKIAPGLADHPDVKNALKRANEELEEALSIPNARREIQKIYDKAKRDGFLGTTGHDDFKELLKQTDRKKLYRDMHKVGSFFASASGAKPKAVGKELVDLSYKVNEELEEGYEKVVLNALQKKGISGYFSKGTLFVDKGDEKAAKDAIDDESSIFKAPKIIGEELEEGMVKRVMQTVHDKLSKEGGAAGFDDLAKEVKKEFGITISKDTLKNMPGVKQHRDGDFILEELEEAKKYKVGDKVKYDGSGYQMGKYKNQIATITHIDYAKSNFGKGAPNHFIKFKDGKQIIAYPDEFKEETELNEFTQSQLARLKKEYEPLKGKILSTDQRKKMDSMLNRYSTDMLVKLANTDIPMLATAAKSIAVMKRGKKWSDFKTPMDMSEADELQCEACWSGYKQVGLKKKGDKMVPNCVPEEVYVELFGEADLSKSQVKMVHKTADKLPKDDFKDRYGKDGDSVRYATATNMVKKKLGISEFTKRDFKNLEKVNDHDGAAKAVVDMHGTGAEKMKIDAIIARNNMRGHITKADQTKRDDIVRKYYNKLKEMNTGRNDIRGSFTNAQLSRMKQTWAKKSISDLTKSVKDYVMKLDKPTQAAIIAAKINHLSDYVDKNFNMKESKVIGEETMAEMSYKDKFAKALKDSGKSLADMSDDEKKKFFNKVDSMHSAKNEEVELQEMQYEMKYEMMKKEMMKKMEMMKAETDPAKLDMMKKEMMKEMGKMPEMMKKEMMKKMDAAYKANMEEAEPMTRDTMSLKAMKMPIRAMYKNPDMEKKDEKYKKEELTPAQKKLPMGLQKAIKAKQDKKDDKQEMMKKKMKEAKYHATKEGSLEDAVMSALTHSYKG